MTKTNTALGKHQKEMAKRNGWRISTRGGVTKVNKFSVHNAQIHVHNPYYLEKMSGRSERQHSNSQSKSSVTFKAMVNYRLSAGGYQVIRPNHGTVLMLPVLSNFSWTLTQLQPSSSTFRLTPPRSEQAIEFDGIHPGKRHPGKTHVANERYGLSVYGHNSIFTGNHLKKFFWSTRFRDGPNGNGCSDLEYRFTCADGEKVSYRNLEYAELFDENKILAAIFTEDERYFVSESEENVIELTTKGVTGISTPIAVGTTLLLSVLVDSYEAALALCILKKEHEELHMPADVISQDKDHVVIAWDLLEESAYTLIIGDKAESISLSFMCINTDA